MRHPVDECVGELTRPAAPQLFVGACQAVLAQGIHRRGEDLPHATGVQRTFLRMPGLESGGTLEMSRTGEARTNEQRAAFGLGSAVRVPDLHEAGVDDGERGHGAVGKLGGHELGEDRFAHAFLQVGAPGRVCLAGLHADQGRAPHALDVVAVDHDRTPAAAVEADVRAAVAIGISQGVRRTGGRNAIARRCDLEGADVDQAPLPPRQQAASLHSADSETSPRPQCHRE